MRFLAAYAPDLPGCVATGPTRPRTIARMRSAIRFHIEGLRATDQRVPPPDSFSTIVEID